MKLFADFAFRPRASHPKTGRRVVMRKADKVGATPERFLELMEKHYLGETFDNNPDTNFDQY